jgi:hypothetical protein
LSGLPPFDPPELLDEEELDEEEEEELELELDEEDELLTPDEIGRASCRERVS